MDHDVAVEPKHWSAPRPQPSPLLDFLAVCVFPPSTVLSYPILSYPIYLAPRGVIQASLTTPRRAPEIGSTASPRSPKAATPGSLLPCLAAWAAPRPVGLQGTAGRRLRAAARPFTATGPEVPTAVAVVVAPALGGAGGTSSGRQGPPLEPGTGSC